MKELRESELPAASEHSATESDPRRCTRRAAVAGGGCLCVGLFAAFAFTGKTEIAVARERSGTYHTRLLVAGPPPDSQLVEAYVPESVLVVPSNARAAALGIAKCTYNIKHARNNLYLSTSSRRLARESKVRLDSNPNIIASQWMLQHIAGTDRCIFASVEDPDMVLNLAGGGQYGLTNVQIYDNPESKDSHWRLSVKGDNESYLIQAVNNHMFMCSDGDHPGSSVKVCDSASEGTAKWKLELLSCNEQVAPNGCEVVQLRRRIPHCTWTVRHVLSGLYLNIQAGRLADWVNIQLYDNPNSADSQWILLSSSNATVVMNLHAKNDEKFLLHSGTDKWGKSVIQLYSNSTSSKSRWLIFRIGNSTSATYLIQSANGGGYLGSKGYTREATVEIMPDERSPHVQWELKPVGPCP